MVLESSNFKVLAARYLALVNKQWLSAGLFAKHC